VKEKTGRTMKDEKLCLSVRVSVKCRKKNSFFSNKIKHIDHYLFVEFLFNFSHELLFFTVLF